MNTEQAIGVFKKGVQADDALLVIPGFSRGKAYSEAFVQRLLEAGGVLAEAAAKKKTKKKTKKKKT